MAARTSGKDRDDDLVSDINITPFVDVVLVLLVIFMVMAPALVKESLNVQLPKSVSKDVSSASTIAIVVTRDGQFLVDGAISTEDALVETVRARLKESPGLQGLIGADGESKHQDVVRAIDLLKQAGLEKFALQVQREKTGSSPK